MVAALFTDAEIAAWLTAKKYMEYESAAKKTVSRSGECTISKLSSEEFPGVIFLLEQEVKPPEGHFTFSVQPNDGRPQSAICRYDIQKGPHVDPDGTFHPPMDPHRHIYKAETFRQFGVWDRTAEPLRLKSNSCQELYAQLLTDLNIHYSDSESQLLDFMKTRPT
jgi:hypothetical protein